MPLSGLALLFASLWAFGVLVEDVVTNDPIVAVDERFADWLHAHARPWLTEIFEAVTALGNAVTVVGVSLVAVLLLLRQSRRADALLVSLAVSGAEILTLALKLGFRRERPFFPDPLATESTFSFPSGHATVSAAVFGAVALVVARRLESWRLRVAVFAAAAVLVLLIGFSRLYLGVHFLSDVLAGLTAGLAWLLICTFAIELRGVLPRARGS